MPSLAQGYGRGLLLGLQLEEAKRQRKSQELLDEYRQEQLADIRWGREKEKKSFLAQIKEKEEKAKQDELIGDIAIVDALGLRTGSQFMRSILAGEETPPETKQRLTSIMDYVPGLGLEEQFKRRRVEEKVEGAPGVRPWYETYLGGEEMRGAAKVAGGLGAKVGAERVTPSWQADRALFSKTPSQMTVEEYRIALSKGREWDPKKGAWIPTRVTGLNLFGGLLGGEGVPPESKIPPEGEEGKIEIDPAIINYINDEATNRAEAEGFLYDMGHTNPMDISNILAKTKFGK